MSFVSVTTARKSLSQLLRRVAVGKTRASGRGVTGTKRAMGTPRLDNNLDKNRVRIAEDFDAPLPPENHGGLSGQVGKAKSAIACKPASGDFSHPYFPRLKLKRTCVTVSRAHLRAREGRNMQSGSRAIRRSTRRIVAIRAAQLAPRTPYF